MTAHETQPTTLDTVIYRCFCGNDVRVTKDEGGKCNKCGRTVSARVLQNDLAVTMTIDGSFRNLKSARIPVYENYDPNDLIGRKFGHYEIIRPLGSGGSGFVFQALDTSLQRYVAVKVLKGASDDESPETADVELLLQEAVSQARVAHPNIVSIYFVGKQDAAPFYAMELVDGISLDERIRQGNISFKEIANIADDIVRALAFSYQLDIIHGDIKPPNILLPQTGGAKLSDFGLARRASEKNKLVTGGSPNYLAPEILNAASPSIQSDMYSLGVTLFELTFRKLPIKLTGSTVAQWQECHQESSVEFPNEWPENLPPQWKTFLQRLLQKDPRKRFRNYQQVSDEIAKLAPTGNLVASPLPRIVAAMIDWTIVVLLMLPSRFLLNNTNIDPGPVIQFVFALVDFVPIILYTVLVFTWKHSVGRSLMQLRVLNRFGMIPKGRKIASRSFVRMIIPWVLATFSLLSIGMGDSWRDASTVILISALIFMVFNSVGLFFSRRNKCLHDVIFETQVVIDS